MEQRLCAGALMGVAYGAASLWPWRLHPDEPGHGSYFLPRVLAGRKHSTSKAADTSAWSARSSMIYRSPKRPLLGCPPTPAACSTRASSTSDAEHGGPWMFFDADGRVPSKYWLIDPRTGRVLKSGERPNYVPIEFDRYEPLILICMETTGLGEGHPTCRS